MKSWIFIALTVLRVNAQVGGEAERQALQQLANRYAGCFTVLSMGRRLPDRDFTRLFTSDTIRLLNDFYDGPLRLASPALYYSRLKKVLLNHRRIRHLRPEFSHSRDFLYAQNDTVYYVWLHKSISYVTRRRKKTYAGWWRLHIQKLASGELRISSIHKVFARPADTDEDGVPDIWDGQPNTPSGQKVDLRGSF